MAEVFCEVSSGRALAWGDEDRVLACDRARDFGEHRRVDRVGERGRIAGGRLDDDERVGGLDRQRPAP
jgi:hypothetical protein